MKVPGTASRRPGFLVSSTYMKRTLAIVIVALLALGMIGMLFPAFASH